MLGHPMIRTILCLPIASFILSWIATFFIRRIAPKIGFVDNPGHRKIHSNPKPLGGGIAIFLGIALPLIAALILLRTPWLGETSGRLNPA